MRVMMIKLMTRKKQNNRRKSEARRMRTCLPRRCGDEHWPYREGNASRAALSSHMHLDPSSPRLIHRRSLPMRQVSSRALLAAAWNSSAWSLLEGGLHSSCQTTSKAGHTPTSNSSRLFTLVMLMLRVSHNCTIVVQPISLSSSSNIQHFPPSSSSVTPATPQPNPSQS